MSTICMINDLGLPLGGQTQIALATAIGMAKMGHEVVYLCGAKEVSPSLAEAGIRTVALGQEELIHATNRRQAALSGLWNRRAYQAVRQLVADLPDDTVFHIHGWSRILSASIFAALRGKMDRVVLTMHDHFSFCPNGGYFNFQTQAICGLTPLGPACALTHCDSRSRGFKLYRMVRHYAAWLLAGFPNCIRNYIVFSRRQEELATRFVRRDARFFVVENPVAAGPDERVVAETNTDILFVGRLSAEKGAPVYAAACVAAGLTPKIVGDGVGRAAVLAVAPEAQISGWMSKEQVAAAMAKARALVFPSIWPETFGLSMFEAVSRGIPVLVSDAVLMKDQLLALGGGVAFKSGDAGDLAAKLRTIISDEHVKQLSVTGFSRYRQAPFSQIRYLTRLAEIYDCLDTGEAKLAPV